MFSGGLEQVSRALYIHALIQGRLLQAGPHTGAGSEVDDLIKRHAAEHIIQLRPLGDIRMNEGEGLGSRLQFAQGILLDVDHGTYPYVTSSNTVPATAATGSGLGPDKIGYILGITKAYTTRVGSGPFPTEDNGKDGISLGKKGHEFGTVTGRQRRCGWFDSVLVRQAVSLSSIKGIALTKLDVLDGFDEIKICTGYSLNGKTVNYLPSAEKEQKLIKPIYEVIKGWKKSIVGVRNLNDLPEEAKIYIKRIEELVNCPIILISTSPERSDTIYIKDPFNPS